MVHELYQLLRLLDEEHLSYRIDRHQPDAIMVTIWLVGERIEISVFEDAHIEYSRFTGDESLESGSKAVANLYQRLRDRNSN